MEPQIPTLNTVCGVLEQNNNPLTEIKPMPGIPPSFESYTNRWEYVDQFPVSVGSVDTDIHRFAPMSVNNTDGNILPFYMLPFRTSRFWNGSVDIKLWAIIPERYGGKFQIIYLPNHLIDAQIPMNLDKQQRYILKEWDLSASDTCEFTVSGFNTILQRPTYYNDLPPAYTDDPSNVYTLSYPAIRTQRRTYHFGTIIIRVIQELQPGSIYPDTIDIVMYKSYPQATFQTITDFRNVTYHSINL